MTDDFDTAPLIARVNRGLVERGAVEELDATGHAVSKGISALRAQRRIDRWRETVRKAAQ